MENVKILIVDDSALMQATHRLAMRHYETQGAQLLTAKNGQEALDLLGEQPDIAFILLDLNMPVMDGLTFLERRRGMARVGRIPVVAVTEEVDADLRKRLTPYNLTGLLQKPYQVTQLQTFVAMAVGSRLEPEQAPSTTTVPMFDFASLSDPDRW